MIFINMSRLTIKIRYAKSVGFHIKSGHIVNWTNYFEECRSTLFLKREKNYYLHVMLYKSFISFVFIVTYKPDKIKEDYKNLYKGSIIIV